MSSKLRTINGTIKTNIAEKAQEWRTTTLQRTRKYVEQVVDRVGELFVEEARQNLIKNGYNTEMYAAFINYSYEQKAVVVSSPSGDEPDIMWYLEYGTGVAGDNNPHPESYEIGWGYAINFGTGSWRYLKTYDKLGWYFTKRSEDIYIAEGDLVKKGGKSVFTSGITPVRYLYDTMLRLPNIIEKAKRQLRKERNQLNNG